MICRGVACCSVIDVINTPEAIVINTPQERHLLKYMIASVDVLPIISADELAHILEFLPVKEIMRSRRVCKQWKDAVRKAIAHGNFCVYRVAGYNAMEVITRAMPNLQQIKLSHLGRGHKWNDGEDPDEEHTAESANRTSHDVEIISNFSKLRSLEIDHSVSLNGRYPFLFNSFPLLQKLTTFHCHYLKWDLEMLAGFPVLEELNCAVNGEYMTGNISSLRVLKNSLEKVTIEHCPSVEGNFMDLADFPHLKQLNLNRTAVIGDIRDIGEHDFSSLEQLTLPKTVYGGRGYEMQRISDAPELIRSVYLLKKQLPALKIEACYGCYHTEYNVWHGKLSRDSPDWTPFSIEFIRAGSRIGYRWITNGIAVDALRRPLPCEVNWLDPEPDRGSSDYGKYIEELQGNEWQVDVFRGFHQPPTEEEYHRLVVNEYYDVEDLFDYS